MRLYKRGSTWWVYDGILPGSNRKSLKTTNKKFAQKKAEKLIEYAYAVKFGLVKEEETIIHVDYQTFYNKVLQYVKARYTPRTLETYTSSLNNLRDWLNLKRKKYEYIQQITTKDIEDFITYRSNFVKNRTINNEMINLKALFYKAIKLNLLAKNKNPIVGISELPDDSKKRYVYKDSEITSLFASFQDYFKPHFSVLLNAGLRKGELQLLEWSDIRFDERYIFIEQKQDRSKTKMKPRLIPISIKFITRFSSAKK